VLWILIEKIIITVNSGNFGPSAPFCIKQYGKFLQCCGCGINIPDPDFYPSRIPDLGCRIQDPKTATKERGEKFCYVIPFYVATNFQRIIELFTQKIVTKLSKVWVWDPGSGKNLFRIPDPGVKKAPDPGSLIRIRNTAFLKQ
jgi:hypothetical protein